MKKRLTFSILAVAALMSLQTANATIWRVNNNPGKSGTFGSVVVFADLTTALRELNSADGMIEVGDTIHLEGSVTPYGKTPQAWNNCDTIARRVVLIGPGYLLSQNTETQHFKESAKVRTIYIAPTAAGTIIAGIEQERPAGNATPISAANGTVPLFNGGYALMALYRAITATAGYGHIPSYGWANEPNAFKLRIAADSITVTHCKLFYVDLFNAEAIGSGQTAPPSGTRNLTNITITKCFFNPGIIAASAGLGSVNNLIISNCFFRNDWSPVLGSGYTAHSVSAFLYYTTIDFRHWTAAANNTANPWYNTAGFAAGVWDQVYNTATANNVYQSYTHVVSPIIQNNTFYNAFSIQGKGCHLYNNLFFPKVNAPHYYGLPKDATRPHVLQGNIVYGGTGAIITGWTGAADAYYTNNYGGMLNDGNNSYSPSAEANWWAGNTTSNPHIDNTFRLANSSPAAGAGGVATAQKGMYGGLAPYALSGLYTIPAVWDISIPSYPSGEVPSTGFEVRVRVRSH